MGIGSRPAACASCGKRLNRKQWYYRNGRYFCKRRCWVTEDEKTKEEKAKKDAVAKTAQAAAKPEAAAEALTPPMEGAGPSAS